MPFLRIKIVFSALLGSSPIESHTVALNGRYPEIEIENLEQPDGLHYFKIRKTVPNLGDSMLQSVASEATAEIEAFWSVLSYLRNSIIQPVGVIQYENYGELRAIGRPIRPPTFATLTVSTGVRWFELNAELFHKRYDYDLLKRFNFARSLEDPISRFLSLYAIISSIAEDNQRKIDELIRNEEPTIANSPSPKGSYLETIFTRLRNELAHQREGASVFGTHEEITIHVERFDWLVRRILAPYIEGA